MNRKASIAIITAIGLVAATLIVVISASAANPDSSANQLAGSWQLTVDRGPALPPVKGLTTYTSDGTLIGTGNTVLRGPAHGAWEHVSGRVYADTHTSSGSIDRHAPRVPEDQRDRGALAGRRLDTAVAISDQFDPSGNLTASGLQRQSRRHGSKSNHCRRRGAGTARLCWQTSDGESTASAVSMVTAVSAATAVSVMTKVRLDLTRRAAPARWCHGERHGGAVTNTANRARCVAGSRPWRGKPPHLHRRDDLQHDAGRLLLALRIRGRACPTL